MSLFNRALRPPSSLTEQAIELFANLETPKFAVAARRLSGELKAPG